MYTLLKCSGMRKWRKNFEHKRLVDENVAYKTILNCNDAVELRYIGKHCVNLIVIERIKSAI
jgi:hypothetical protein